MELSIELAAEMVVMGERWHGRSTRRGRLCRRTIADGRALERFRRLIERQGGDPRVVDDPTLLPAPRRRIDVTVAAQPDSSGDWPRGRSAMPPCCWGPAGPGWTRRSTRRSESSCTRKSAITCRRGRAAVHAAGQ